MVLDSPIERKDPQVEQEKKIFRGDRVQVLSEKIVRKASFFTL